MIKPLSFINLCICVSSFKLLFLKSYVSTDFDVHRNWMAITYNLPIKDWYFDTTSEWTLDYPPLFGAFEFLLALIAHLFNLQDALLLSKSSIRIESIIIYQKITVIISDLVYYYSIYKLCNSLESLIPKVSSNSKNRLNNKSDKIELAEQRQNLLDAIYRPNETSCIALLLLLQPGLLLVDHIHFQYNGLLSGLFLLSVANIVAGKYLSGGFWFAILLNFKHIYLYYAPAFGMYLLTSYCMAKASQGSRLISFLKRGVKLGMLVLIVFTITYAPFFEPETLKQIFMRLFPFKRGLTHAYWAPNFWSLYNTVDKILATIFRDSLTAKFDLESISRTKQTSTSGLVQEYEHQYFPTVKPIATFILVATLTVPLVIKFLLTINHRFSPRLFMKGLAIAAFTSFMFGWHVHEKAIILVLLPVIPISFIDHNLRDTFLRLTIVGTYSLFPLLFQPAEYLTKVCILIAYYCYARSINFSTNKTYHQAQSVSRQRSFSGQNWSKLYNLLDKSYLLMLILIELYITLIHGKLNYNWNPFVKLNRYDFLPLMLTSSLSALGITFSYLELYYDFISCDLAADEAAAA